jgi:hypothetical protein
MLTSSEYEVQREGEEEHCLILMNDDDAQQFMTVLKHHSIECNLPNSCFFSEG